MNRRSSRIVRGAAVCLSAAISFSAAGVIAFAGEIVDRRIEIKPSTQPVVVVPGPNPDHKHDDGGELIKPIKPATKPTTGPTAKKEDKKKVEVSPQIATLLDSVREAYAKLKGLKVEGTILGEMDLNGEQTTHHAHFTASFKSPTEFHHQLREQVAGKDIESMLIGGTGKKLYVYEPAYKYYYLTDVPKEMTEEALGRQVAGSLEQQNLSLLLAVVKDASQELLDGIDKIEKLDDVKIGADSFPTVRLTIGTDMLITISFDAQSHLVRRVVWDRKGYMQAHKQQDVKKALVTTDYTATEINPDLSAEKFAWTPPLGARDVTASGGADLAMDDAADGNPDAAHAALIGKPAPDFKLKGLDGTEVKLSDLKGNVVLIDFWATWCGPCRASLPHLDEIYKELKDKGLKAYAVDLREKDDTVKNFVESTKLGIPVLLDADGKVAKSFGVSGIPQTVVIDKEGKIAKIVVGSGTHEQVKKAIEEALK